MAENKDKSVKSGPRRATVLVVPKVAESIRIDSHRDLVAKAGLIEARVGQDPGFSVMFLSNPVLALEAYGIKLSPQMQHHVLSTLRHPPKLRTRREELEAILQEALGEKPHPEKPEWLAYLVFVKREIGPRQIAGLEPIYSPALNADALERLQGNRPKGVVRYPGVKRLPIRFSLGVAPSDPTLRRIDLDAELPKLEPAYMAPDALTLEQAWFYKDDPLVHDAVELGQIMRRGFPFRTPAEFRAIQAGTRVDAFRKFVRNVRVKGFRPT
jgi:hypothetical protein